MTEDDFEKIGKLCRAVSKHKTLSEDGMVSVAFAGNCGVFAMALLDCLAMNFPEEKDFEWEVGFIFNNIRSPNDLYRDNEADLNHVVAIIDGKCFDGEGETDPKIWHGKFFKIDDVDKIMDIISNFTESSVDGNRLEKLFKKEYNNIFVGETNESDKNVDGFNISKYITSADIVAAVTAGVIAYIRNKPKPDDKKSQPSAEKPVPKQSSKADPTIRVDRGKINIKADDFKVVRVPNGQTGEIVRIKCPDGSMVTYNPASGQNPTDYAMSRFRDRLLKGEVDMDKLRAGASAVAPAAPKVRVPQGISVGKFTPTNPPSFNDMSDQANMFWLNNPAIAKAHGITVKNVVKTADGICGIVQHASQDTIDQINSDYAAMMADQALKKASHTAMEMAISASKMGKFDLAEQLLAISKSNDVNAINSAISAASKIGVTARW